MADRRPNLLIVMVDQMQAQLLDAVPPAHCRIDLPNLRRLRERSFLFTRCYCPAPICTPTRASFQLGLAVHRHGVTGNGQAMPADRRTLANWLSDAGYDTSYVGKWHLDPDSSRGWRRFDAVKSGGVDGDYAMAGCDAPHEGVAPYGEEEHVDGRVLAASQDELRNLTRGDRPFALMVSFYGPHAPYYLPAHWHDHVNPAAVPLPDDFDAPMRDKPPIQHAFRCRAWGERWSEDKWRRVRAAYFGYCAMIDAFVGRLLATLEETGAAGDTAVLFLSDHGENNGHRRMIYKGPMMYEQLVRVPAMLSLPGRREATEVAGLTSILDLTATLVGLAGVSPTHALDGIDFSPRLRPETIDSIGRSHVISEFHEANWVRPAVAQRVAMIRDERFKYVLTEGQGEELYDLHTSPSEVINLMGDPAQRERAGCLRQALADDVPWVAEVLTTQREEV